MTLRLRSPVPGPALIWPRFNSGTGLDPAPTAALTHICHSRPGEEAAGGREGVGGGRYQRPLERDAALVTGLASRQVFLSVSK